MGAYDRDYWRTPNNPNQTSKTPWIILLIIICVVSTYSITKYGLSPTYPPKNSDSLTPTPTVALKAATPGVLDHQTGIFLKSEREVRDNIIQIIDENLQSALDDSINKVTLQTDINEVEKAIEKLELQIVSKEYDELRNDSIKNDKAVIDMIQNYLSNDNLNYDTLFALKQDFSECVNTEFKAMRKLFDENKIRYRESVNDKGETEILYYYENR